jgi:hypothetical protein
MAYQSLVRVSCAMQALVYHECLPYLPVMLHTHEHVDSFGALLDSPTAAGPRIRSPWIIVDTKTSTERTRGHTIVQKCTHLTRLAYNINLIGALASSAVLEHHNLKHLTLIETIVPWERLLEDAAGRPANPPSPWRNQVRPPGHWLYLPHAPVLLLQSPASVRFRFPIRVRAVPRAEADCVVHTVHGV